MNKQPRLFKLLKDAPGWSAGTHVTEHEIDHYNYCYIISNSEVPINPWPNEIVENNPIWFKQVNQHPELTTFFYNEKGNSNWRHTFVTNIELTTEHYDKINSFLKEYFSKHDI